MTTTSGLPQAENTAQWITLLETQRLQLEGRMRGLASETDNYVAKENRLARQIGNRPEGFFEGWGALGDAWRRHDRWVASTYGRSIHIMLGTLRRYQDLARQSDRWQFTPEQATRAQRILSTGNTLVRELQTVVRAYEVSPYAHYDPAFSSPERAVFQLVVPDSVWRHTTGITSTTHADVAHRGARTVAQAAATGVEAVSPLVAAAAAAGSAAASKGQRAWDWKDYLALIGGGTIAVVGLGVAARMRGII